MKLHYFKIILLLLLVVLDVVFICGHQWGLFKGLVPSLSRGFVPESEQMEAELLTPSLPRVG